MAAIQQRESGPAAARGATEAPRAPRVSTLLICDLADSTALVERLGDARAAELIHRHDRTARELMQRIGGREIDKTDGFLLLFERPVQAVAFALAYQRALHALGAEVRQPLRARVGIHVGEVVLWENSAADVAAGAKAVEVEGLAKPVVARLMALALPGQIVLSGVAFSLAQRAEQELHAAAPLRWLTHGRYRFKGVAAPMLVHEVGESGFAPLQAPPSGPKAQRDVPLWRRPGVLGLEALALLTALAVPFALSLRAPPAIAFGERDWIVMGDLRNLTGEVALDDSLETAFRISLEQSRYVNVLPDLKLRDALARMQRPADAEIDRAVASEIALREGARAVILPTVAEIGGRVRVSAEVIDPHTQTTVYAESADGVGAPSALDSIDRVTQELRAKLGEALAAIEKDSSPLPKVTSADLDALRAYALATQAQANSRDREAAALYDRAIQLDPDFALAYLGQTRLRMAVNDRVGAMGFARRALSLRARLTPRDALYADAWLASFGPPVESMEKWRLLADMYPDYYAGSYNFALYSAQYANRYEEAIAAAKRALVPQNPLLAGVYYTLGFLYAAEEDFVAANEHFRRANELGESAGGDLQASVLLAQGKRDAAAELIESGRSRNTGVERALARRAEIAAALDQGRTRVARDAASAALSEPGLDGVWRDVFALAAATSATLEAEAPRDELRELVERQRPRIADPEDLARDQALYAALLAGYLAARIGEPGLAEQALELAEQPALLSGYPNVVGMAVVLRAELARVDGNPQRAIELLEDARDGRELYQVHSAHLRALRDAGRVEDALRAAEWLAEHRGRAFVEWGSYRSQTPLNVVDASLAMLDQAELLAALGRREQAALALARFRRAWPQPPDSIRRRVEAIDGEN